jgi:hypothetical protein
MGHKKPRRKKVRRNGCKKPVGKPQAFQWVFYSDRRPKFRAPVKSNQVIMGYRPIATINLFSTNQEIHVIMRRFGMNPDATRPRTISNYFMLDSTIEYTQQKRTFLDSMAFLEGIKAQLEDYGRKPVGDDYIPQKGKIEVTKPFAETEFPSKINLIDRLKQIRFKFYNN